MAQKLLTPSPKTSVPKETGFTQSAYGSQIPRIYGYHRTSTIRIWRKPQAESIRKSGKGGSFKGSNERLYASWAELISDRPAQLVKILANGDVIYDLEKESSGDTKWRDANRKLEKFFTFYNGTQTSPDPTIVAREGITKVPSYQGFCYLVFNGLNCETYGNRIPSIDVMVYSPVGVDINTVTPTYGSPGYSSQLYVVQLRAINNLNQTKILTVNNVQGPILGADILLSTPTSSPTLVDSVGTIRLNTGSGYILTSYTGSEWGLQYKGVPPIGAATGAKASVTIDSYLLNGKSVTTNYSYTGNSASVINSSNKVLTIEPQKVKTFLNTLIDSVNANSPFLRAKLDTSEVSDDLVFSGYKTSGNFDILSVLMETVKTYSLYLTYKNAIPALSSQIDPDYYELNDSDFVCDEDKSPYEIDYTDYRQTPKELIFKYSNSEQDIQDDVVIARIASSDYNGGLIEESTAFSMKHATAKSAALIQLCQTASRGTQFTFKLHPRRKDITIGTLLYYEGFGNIVKCDEIKYGFDFSLQVKATVYNPVLDYLNPTYVNNLNGSTTSSSNASGVSNASLPGRIVPKNIPIFDSSNLNNSLYVALVAQPNYVQGEVRTSFDAGASYTSAFNMSVPCEHGFLTQSLSGSATHLLEDKVNETVVKLDYGQLYSLTENDYNNYAVLLLINDEIVCYRYATLEADGYRLSKLQRGLYGTERHIKDHDVGSEVFVLGGMRRITDDLANIDRPRLAILVDYNAIASDATPVDATNNGESIRPYSPYLYSVVRDRNDIVLSWTPRDRLQPGLLNNFITQTDPDNYRLKIGATRVVNTLDRTYTYTQAEQVADGFTGNSLTVDLVHLGAQAVDSASNPKTYAIL